MPGSRPSGWQCNPNVVDEDIPKCLAHSDHRVVRSNVRTGEISPWGIEGWADLTLALSRLTNSLRNAPGFKVSGVGRFPFTVFAPAMCAAGKR
jgi:hypothetical protein